MSKKKDKEFVEPDLDKWLIPRLRRLSYSWPSRGEAKKRARVARNQYKCAHCKELFGHKEIRMDHDVPIVDPKKGYQGVLSWILRAFVPVEGWNVLCNECHTKKTNSEGKVRTKTRKSKKKPKYK